MLTKILIATGVLLILVAHPVTRRIVFIILPLGRSFDDIVFWVILVVFALVAFVKGWVNLPKFLRSAWQVRNIEREEK